MTVYIYALIEDAPTFVQFRYIGQTKNLKSRLTQHRNSDNRDLRLWLNTSPNTRMIVLETLTGFTEEQVKIKEWHNIEKWKPVYNLHRSTTRKARVVAGRMIPFRAKTLLAYATKINNGNGQTKVVK